jgi:hypothetical protein
MELTLNKGDEVHLNCPDCRDDDFYFLTEVEVFFLLRARIGRRRLFG